MESKIYNGSRIINNVKITVYSGRDICRTIEAHNTATINLCEYLRDALIGEHINARRPGIITPCQMDASGDLVDIGKGSPYISDKKTPVSEEDEVALVTITFLIPNSILTAGTEIYGFKLYSKDSSKKLYAELKLSDLEIDPIIAGGDSNMKVEWTLAVSYR